MGLRTTPWQMLACWLLASAAWCQQAVSPDAFFGEYTGEAIVDASGELDRRDISVTVGPRERGFFVDWTTVTKKSDGSSKKKAYSIDFKPTSRAGVFGSAMRTNMFGQQVPLDPMKGDPYVWARIVERTLTVYALHITDDGGYEMQTYHRTLVDGGLALEFTRLRDGEALRTVTGELRRTR